MTTMEVFTPEVVEEFDKARAGAVLRRIDAAMSSWVRSTVELADLAFEAKNVECWRVDGAFLDAKAAGAIAPADDQRHVGRDWLAWKFNRAGRTIRDLVDYGELRSIIAADPSLPALAEPESAARPLGKLLRPRYLSSETPNIAERNEAIREVYGIAVKMTESGTAAEAIKMIPKALKKSEYRPLRRLLTKSEGQKSLERQAAILRARKQMTAAIHDLLRLGAFDVFDEVLAETAEARHRVAR